MPACWTISAMVTWSGGFTENSSTAPSISWARREGRWAGRAAGDSGMRLHYLKHPPTWWDAGHPGGRTRIGTQLKKVEGDSLPELRKPAHRPSRRGELVEAAIRVF